MEKPVVPLEPGKEKEKRVAMRPMSLPNGNEQRFENRPDQRAAESSNEKEEADDCVCPMMDRA